VSRELATEAGVRSVQPNFRYLLREQKAQPAEGGPAQYALLKLRLPEAHKLARGADVRGAVIDSGIDAKHVEPANSIGDTFSAAYVSALAALMLEHNPELTPQALRAALTRTARDLGSPGRDDLFGAGEADAYAAVWAVTETPTPLAVSAPPNEAAARAMKTDENASEPKELPGSRGARSACRDHGV
jgi:subtilisin family serine protease